MTIVLSYLWIFILQVVAAYSSSGSSLFPQRKTTASPFATIARRSSFLRSTSSSSDGSDNDPADTSSMATNFSDIVMNRYACTRFQRYDGKVETVEDASPSDPSVVQNALECLDLARRAPSGFNAQPYKLILVESTQQKQLLAKYCIGHNAHRVRDSDCTAVFLSDREAARTMREYKSFVVDNNPNKWKNRKWAIFKMQALIILFSSGYPLPRFLGVPISFGVRLGVSLVSILTFRKVLVPTLSNAETWSTKNTMLVAMSYMLACTSRGLATCPMEGFNAGGIRRSLNIPRRYSIPIIVSTGRPYIRPKDAQVTDTDSADDMGMTHGSPAEGSTNSTPRYDANNVLFQDKFGRE